MSPPDPREAPGPGAPPFLVAVPLSIWLVLVNVVGFLSFGFGPLTFLMLASIALIVLCPRRVMAQAEARLPERLRRMDPPGVRRLLARALAVLVILTGIGVYFGLTLQPDRLIDLSANTYAAGGLLLEGRNPYRGPAQLEQKIQPGPHAEVGRDGVRLYGFRYDHGFPYFPGLMLSYLPLRAAFGGYAAIRVENVLLIVVTAVAMARLAAALAPDHRRTDAVLLSLVAHFGALAYSIQMVYLGIVDVVISTYAVLAYLALHRGRPAISGVLFGLAQACKLLPGPLLVLPAVIYLLRDRRRDALSLSVTYVATSLVAVVPFVVWDPEAFLSATILFYVVHHGGGDATSLWFFLPRAVRPVFQVVGVLLALLVAFRLPRAQRADLMAPILASFVCYLAFMAFSPMTHLNYLWGIWPLGCVGLAVSSLRAWSDWPRAVGGA